MNLSTVVTQPGTSGSKQATVSPALIGPNAVIQTLAAVQVLEGAATRDHIAQLAGLPTAEPAALIPETSFLSLIAALRREFDDATSREVLALAGEKTGGLRGRQPDTHGGSRAAPGAARAGGYSGIAGSF